MIAIISDKYCLMMERKHLIILFLLISVFFIGSENAESQEKNWTHFRGSNLNGIAEKDNIPVKWDESTIKWKTEIHDMGHSSPVVFGNQVWLTTASSGGEHLYALCIDFSTGKVIHDIKVFEPAELFGKHQINTFASPTPCIEEGSVYVHFGSAGTACIRTDNGSVVWKRTDLKCRHVQGPGSSPVLYRNLLILHYEGTDIRYLVALDKSTGKTVWRSDRPEEPYKPLPEIGRKAYVTPLVTKVNGRDLLISNGSAVCITYEPMTGKEVWRVVRGAESTVPMPVAENGIVCFYTGSMVNPDGSTYTELLAVNPDGKGDIGSTNVIWRKKDIQTQTQILTPVFKNGLIYSVTSRNDLMCIDASTGEEVWTTHLRSNHNASPLYINGNVWLFSIKGEVMAVRAGKSFEPIARNQMDSGIWGTPAVVRNSVIVRTEKFLYRISN